MVGFSFRMMEIDIKNRMVDCGHSDAFQVNIQGSLNTKIRLLQETPDPHCAPDADLANLARQVNDYFEAKAKALLAVKRTALGGTSGLDPDVPGRTEVSALITDRGIQLAYAYACERKEIAPMPRKSFFRHILGPLYPGRKFWVMPVNEGDAGKTYTVNWPWAFWIGVVLVALAVGWLVAGHPGYSGPLKMM